MEFITLNIKEEAIVNSSVRGWRYYFQSKIISLFFLGFSAGLPFPLVYSTLSAWLEEANIERSTISTFAWLGFAYSFKFLWSPLVDSLPIPLLTRWLGRRRSWLLASQMGLGISIFVLSTIDPIYAIGAFTMVAILVALLSATQDIALDAYRIEIAAIDMQGLLAAAYQYGYRIAFAFGTAGALLIAEFGSWATSYKVMAICMTIGIVTTLLSKEPETVVSVLSRRKGTKLQRLNQWTSEAVIGPFNDFMKRYGAWTFTLFAFIALFRISDYVMGILANPFYLDIGFSKTEIASVTKIYGLGIIMLGVAGGAAAILKFGVARCIIIATILIASTNLFFVGMAISGASLKMLVVTITADNFANGFAGTVFIAYLSSLTNVSFSATQYALLTSVSTFLGKFTAGYSGNIQEAIGWAGFFLYAAALGLPAIILSIVIARGYKKINSSNE